MSEYCSVARSINVLQTSTFNTAPPGLYKSVAPITAFNTAPPGLYKSVAPITAIQCWVSVLKISALVPVLVPVSVLMPVLVPRQGSGKELQSPLPLAGKKRIFKCVRVQKEKGSVRG